MTPGVAVPTPLDEDHDRKVRHAVQDSDRGAAAIGKELHELLVPFKGTADEALRYATLLIHEKPIMAPVLHIANYLLGGPEPPKPAEGLGPGGHSLVTDRDRTACTLDPSVHQAVARCKQIAGDRPANIMTYSASGTVEAVLDLLQEDGALGSVYLSEAQPGGEGRALAARIAAEWGTHDTRVILTHDAALPALLPQVDLLLLGADLVTNRGIVNKVGTAAIVERAHREGVPVLVAATPDKAPPGGIRQSHLPLPMATDAGELMDPPTGVDVVGIAFEWVDLRGFALPAWVRELQAVPAEEELLNLLHSVHEPLA